MPDPFSTRGSDPYAVLGRRILDALTSLAPGAGETTARLLSEADFSSLINLSGETPPARILDVGGGPGATAMLLALAFPGARIISIDPDQRIETPASASPAAPATISWTAMSLAQAAATRLGLTGRIRFASGAFAGSPRSARIKAVGPDICASEPDFDLIVLDAAAEADARVADLRLAASALAPTGVIAIRGAIGPDAALVRASVFEFLRYNPAFHFVHAPLAEARGALGFLRHRSAGWFPGIEAPHPVRPEEVRADIRDGIADQVGLMVGERPVLEVAVGAPLLGAGFRQRGGTSRALRLTSIDWNARFFDPLIDQILSALDHAPGSVLYSSDLIDFASDEFVTRLFARLADRQTPVVLSITPPGEAGVAGPASRPAARVIDLAMSQTLSAYGPAGLEFETARHAQRDDEDQAAASSRYLSLLMFAGKAGWRDANGRTLVEISPATASQHEQVELQRIQTHAAMKARLAEQHEARRQAETREADLADRLEATKWAADVARVNHEKALEAHQQDMAALRGELKDQTELNRSLHARLEESETLLIRERQRVVDAEAEFTNRLRASETALADQRDRFQRDLSDLSERLEDALRRESAAEKNLTDLRAELDAREAAVADARTRIGLLTSERANLETQMERLTESMTGARTQLESLTAEATRASSELQASRESEAALRADHDNVSRQLVQARNRIDELMAFRNSKTAENDRLTQMLTAANTRLLNVQTQAAGADELKAQVADMQEKLSAANNQVVGNALREMDARLRLDGIDAHLALSQQVIDHYRNDPSTFRAATLLYPEAPQDAPTGEQKADDLVVAAKALHGRAADVSRELARVLEEAAQRRPTTGALQARIAANEASHRTALETMQAEFADRLARAGETERTYAELASGANNLSGLIGRIEGLLPAITPAGAPAGAPPAPLQPTPDTTPAAQMMSWRQRLEHVLHTLEANATARSKPQPVAEPARAAAKPAARETTTAPAKDWSAPPAQRREGDAPPAWAPRPPADPAPESRSLADRSRDWLRTYPETFRLTRLQFDLRDRFEKLGLKPLLFDAAYYVSSGSIAPYDKPLDHYLLVGEAEGRRPLPGFDPKFYASRIDRATVGRSSLLGHFFAQGADKGLSPSAEMDPLPKLAEEAKMSPLEYFFRNQKAPAPKPA